MRTNQRGILTACCVILFLLLLFPARSYSANFSVNPIKIYFNGDNKTNVLKVMNNSDEKITLQLTANDWTHDLEGNNIYSPTTDLIFFPKALTLDKNEEKIIRIGTKITSGGEEKTYRLFLEEVATPSQADTTSVRMLMKVGVPIFISPTSTNLKGRIEKIELDKGNLGITVTNEGNVHILMRSVKVSGIDETGSEVFNIERGGWYLHAGKSKVMTMKMPGEYCYKTKTLQVNVDTDRLSIDDKFEIDKAMCSE